MVQSDELQETERGLGGIAYALGRMLRSRGGADMVEGHTVRLMSLSTSIISYEGF